MRKTTRPENLGPMADRRKVGGRCVPERGAYMYDNPDHARKEIGQEYPGNEM